MFFCVSAFGVEEVRVSTGSRGEQMQMQTPEGVLMLAGPCDGENQCADTGGSELVAANLGGLNVFCPAQRGFEDASLIVPRNESWESGNR